MAILCRSVEDIHIITRIESGLSIAIPRIVSLHRRGQSCSLSCDQPPFHTYLSSHRLSSARQSFILGLSIIDRWSSTKWWRTSSPSFSLLHLFLVPFTLFRVSPIKLVDYLAKTCLFSNSTGFNPYKFFNWKKKKQNGATTGSTTKPATL